MSFIVRLIDTIMAKKGKKAYEDMKEQSLDPRKANEELLLRILNDNKDTEYGRKYGFASIKSIEEYRKKVPLSDYDNYHPYIQRMIKNQEENLITVYPILHYAETSGSIGVQKQIPVTVNAMKIYEKYSIGRTKYMAELYYKEHPERKLAHGKGLNMVEAERTTLKNGVPVGSVTGSVARRYRKIFPFFLSSPDPVHFPIGGMNMNYMKARFALEEPNLSFLLSAFMANFVDMLNYVKKNWEMIVSDIENGTIDPSVCEDYSREAMMKYVKKNPKRAAQLRKIFEEGFDTPIIPRIWPKMSWACAIGNGTFAPYCEKFRKYAGEDIPIDYFVFAASEGMFAVCIKMNEPSFLLLPDSCFFEFRLADANDDDNNTLTIDQLEEGKEYEVIITNQGGFYRYKIRDVVRVLGFFNKTPLVTFAYRKGQLISAAGEKTTEEHLCEAVKIFGKELGVAINDFAIYLDNEGSLSRYVMLIEPDEPLDISKDEEYAETFERIISEVNKEYAFLKQRGSLGKPLVLIQQPETHALWRELKMSLGSSSNQVKPVRVLDTPMKQKFFFKLLEEGQTALNWDIYAKKVEKPAKPE